MKEELREDQNLRQRINSIAPARRNSAPKQQKLPKPKTITEIPRFLMKVSSSLFKKATAAEIFLNHMEKQKKNMNNFSKAKDSKNILKVTDDSRTEKTNIVHNLMSEPSSIPKMGGRRKSIEVLMTEKSVVAITGAFNPSPPGKVTRLHPQPSLIKGSPKLHKNGKDNKDKAELNLSMRSE